VTNIIKQSTPHKGELDGTKREDPTQSLKDKTQSESLMVLQFLNWKIYNFDTIK